MDAAERNAADLAGERRLFGLLDDLGIAHETVRHPPVFTVAESRALRGTLEGGHAKTLYLKSKKDERVLAVVEESRRVDLKALADLIATARLSFAQPARLEAELGVAPGSVTPFALINADRALALRVVLDQALMRLDPLHFHPLHNAATTRIATADFRKFIAATGHGSEVMEFPAADPI